ncbi:MarR family winged helix-turn-helix transcriptional regulator [Haloferax sp. Q22]|uniref:MarR family winged helix-turn-helix transcriptional regulator n=1 Tax=Haloferax sp. (strain Q22) TaxID=1526048 RepID=UPI00373FCAC8
MDEAFLNPKTVQVLISLTGGTSYASEISTEVDCTYSHTVRILDKFEEYGLVEREKDGRKVNCSLTDEGQKRAEALVGFLEAGGENQ